MKYYLKVNTESLTVGTVDDSGAAILMDSNRIPLLEIKKLQVVRTTISASAKRRVYVYDQNDQIIFSATDISGDDKIFSRILNASLTAYADLDTIITALETLIN